jgi:hypothetical protein
MARPESRSRKAIDHRCGGVCVVLISVFVALSIFFSANFCCASDTNAAAVRQLELRGAIKDALGRPIADVEVRLEEGDRVVARTQTDSVGAFWFQTVAPGIYTISLKKQGFKQRVETIVVSPGKSHEPIFLALEATGPLTLKLITERLNRARNDLAPEIGATAYRFDQQAIHRLPEGQTRASHRCCSRRRCQPGFVWAGARADSYSWGNGGGIQYRIKDIFLPEAVTSFGEIFSPRFVHSITLPT